MRRQSRHCSSSIQPVVQCAEGDRGLQWNTAETRLSSGYSRCQEQSDTERMEEKHWPRRASVQQQRERDFNLDWWSGELYLVQVRHEVLVERADQHVEGPLTLLGKRWCLQCGFLSIDY